MLQSFHKALRSSSQPLNLPTQTLTLTPSSPSQFQPLPTSPSLPVLEHRCRLSRRELTICSNSCLLLLLGAQGLLPLTSRAEENLTNTDRSDRPEENLAEENLTSTTKRDQPVESFAGNASDQPEENLAEENLTNTTKSDQPEESLPANASGCTERKPTKTVFFDISIDGEPAGRITIGLYGDDVPTGVERFSKIVSGAAGISYRRKEFVKIMPNYVQHGGLRSYGLDAELAKGKGSNLGTESLVEEWEGTYERCPGTKNLAGSVGLIVRDPSKPPPKLKLVARRGKLEIDQEEVGTEPNGTEFVIATRDSPELDASALVIGRVIGGMEVVQKIGQVKTVQENTSSPYFRVAKLIGDKRAVVAERGFNRPYSKVVVTNCGVLD